MRVIVAEPIHQIPLEKLRQNVDELVSWEDPAAKDWSRADAVIVRAADVTREQIASALQLKVIGKHGIGVNAIDVKAARERGIQVVYTPAANVSSVAELIMAMIMNLSRKLEENMKAILAGAERITPPELTGLELEGKNLGLVGLGRIAQKTGKIARGGFDMRLHAYDPVLDPDEFERLGVIKYERLEDLMAVSDFISVSVPLTQKTINLISAEELAFCKPTAILVNTSRGGVVNEHDLYEAMAAGRIFGAGSDVFEQEPPRPDNPLLKLPNFIGTLHVGACTEEALLRVGNTVAEDVLAVLKGCDPKYPYRGN
ncbi:MAG: hydroxyacid dehydrogenase [Candidatus Adiutrix sp.]|jgi:D-3-phosphoglycerate dehydrogenase|nr:hydroxyacid dehydrogenase [Candidatus Adiutrix sp.]